MKYIKAGQVTAASNLDG